MYWRKDVQAKRWIGRAVAQALGLDVDDKAYRAKACAKALIWGDWAWTNSGKTKAWSFLGRRKSLEFLGQKNLYEV